MTAHNLKAASGLGQDGPTLPNDNADLVTALRPAQAERFLQLLGKDPARTWFRTITPGKGANRSRAGADLQGLDLAALTRDNSNGASVYLVVGDASTASGGVKDADIETIPALFVEWDDMPMQWQLTAWQTLNLPEPSLMVASGGKSLHTYWLLDQPMAPDQWRDLTAQLIAHCNSDSNCCNPSRVMRLPGFAYIDKATGKPTGTIAEILHESDNRYSAAEIEACLPAPQQQTIPNPSTTRATTRATTRDLPPRGLDQIRAAADCIPARVPGNKTYDKDRRALCGCAAALAEIGLPEEQALDLLANKWPSRAEAQQVLSSSTTRAAGSFWGIAAEHGFDLRQRPEPVYDFEAHGEEQATSTAADAADPSRAEVQRLTYRELLALALEAIRIRDQDAEMDLRAELKNTYRISDEQINSALFKQHSASRIKPTERRHDSVCLSEVETLEYLVDGWIPRGDICLTYGSYGTGKTTLAIWKAYCYAKGHNILDRSTPCTPGRSLIIATDSGAAALKKAFSDLGIDPDNDPLLQPGHPEQRIWIWAYAPEQGHAAWICDINGVIQLEEFIKAKEISYVAIDSAKSVSSAADWSYTSNESVKAILTYLREGVCQPTGTCIELLSHDGTAQGSHSGAKAWAEEPSMVCALSVATDPEGRPAGVTAEFKKDRAALVDPRRSLTYKLQDGELVLRPEVEVVGTCEDAILTVLWEAHQRGVEQLKTNSLIEEVWTRFKRSRKTVENTLGRITGTGKGPKPTPLIRPQRGWVALSPLQVQQRASLYRGPYEMGGEVSKSTAAQGICFPPIETPTGEVGGNANPPQTPTGEVIGGSHPPVVATDLDLSPPMGGGTPPQAAQQVTIHIPAPAPTPSAARQLLGIGELVEVADRTYAPEGVFEVIEAEGDKLLIEGPQGHATPLVISVPAAQCEVVF